MRRCAVVIIPLFCITVGCSDPESYGLYDPGDLGRPTPIILSVSPADSAIAGMDTVYLQGQNFSSTAAENTVFFNKEPATVLSASPTQLVLTAPLAPGDSVAVRVAVIGAVAFSNTVPYSLTAAVTPFGRLAEGTNLIPPELASALTVDAAGDVYVGFIFGTSDGGVLHITSDEIRSTYAPATAGVLSWTGLKFSAGGTLFAARNIRAVYTIVPGGGASGALWGILPSGVRIADIDFDISGNLWGGGDNTALYRIQPDKSISTFPFDGNVRSLRVYNDYLYIAADTGDGDKIWRGAITPSGVGAIELYFDVEGTYPGAQALALTIASDGTLCIGTQPPYGLVLVNSGGSASAPYGAYAGMFGSGLTSLAWGIGENMYAATVEGDLLKVSVQGKTSAPYLGNAQ